MSPLRSMLRTAPNKTDANFRYVIFTELYQEKKRKQLKGCQLNEDGELENIRLLYVPVFIELSVFKFSSSS